MGIDEKELKALLERIDGGLDTEKTICLIGSGATMLLGQPARGTGGIDIWAEASKITAPAFRVAIEGAGLQYDPKAEFPSLPYVQIIHPGIVQVPGFDPLRRRWFKRPEQIVWRGGKLTVTCPPGEALIASKLMRGSDRDLEDCLWIIASQRLSAAAIIKAIKMLPPQARAEADANFEILNLTKPR